jgi:hypothetical protein
MWRLFPKLIFHEWHSYRLRVKQKPKWIPWPLVRERTILTERSPLVGEVSTNSYGCFLNRSRYFFFQVAPELYSRDWVDTVRDPSLLRKSGGAGNRTQKLWTCSMELWPLNHKGRHRVRTAFKNCLPLSMKDIPLIFSFWNFPFWNSICCDSYLTHV